MTGSVALCPYWHRTETNQLGLLLHVLIEACQRQIVQLRSQRQAVNMISLYYNIYFFLIEITLKKMH